MSGCGCAAESSGLRSWGVQGARHISAPSLFNTHGSVQEVRAPCLRVYVPRGAVSPCGLFSGQAWFVCSQTCRRGCLSARGLPTRVRCSIGRAALTLGGNVRFGGPVAALPAARCGRHNAVQDSNIASEAAVSPSFRRAGIPPHMLLRKAGPPRPRDVVQGFRTERAGCKARQVCI